MQSLPDEARMILNDWRERRSALTAAVLAGENASLVATCFISEVDSEAFVLFFVDTNKPFGRIKFSKIEIQFIAKTRSSESESPEAERALTFILNVDDGIFI